MREGIEALVKECIKKGNMKIPVMINPKFSYCSIYSHYKESGIGNNFCSYLAEVDTSINGMVVRLCRK